MEVIFSDTALELDIPDNIQSEFSEGARMTVGDAFTYVETRLGVMPRAEQLVIDLARADSFTGTASLDNRTITLAYTDSSLLDGDPFQVPFDNDGLVSPFPVAVHELVHTAEKDDKYASIMDDIMSEGLAHVATFSSWVATGASAMPQRLRVGIIEGLQRPDSLLEEFDALLKSVDTETWPSEDLRLALGHRSPGVKVGMAATVVALHELKSWKEVFALPIEDKFDLLQEYHENR